jgi:hypothetical protein
MSLFLNDDNVVAGSCPIPMDGTADERESYKLQRQSRVKFFYTYSWANAPNTSLKCLSSLSP